MQILKVKYLHDYKLEVLFTNGKILTADFEMFLTNAKNNSISKFLDKEEFKTVTVDNGFLSWNEGEMEISALSVYTDFSTDTQLVGSR